MVIILFLKEYLKEPIAPTYGLSFFFFFFFSFKEEAYLWLIESLHKHPLTWISISLNLSLILQFYTLLDVITKINMQILELELVKCGDLAHF